MVDTDDDVWQEIADDGLAWNPFDACYHFRPGRDSTRWPGIDEPAGSVTFDLAPAFARKEGFAADEDAVTALTLTAMMSVFAADVPLIALDWQHPSYRFWPHRQAQSARPWRVPVFPNGDYYAFLSPDLEQGTFGHPWEQTLCVFGDQFGAALIPHLATWLPVLRQN